MRTTVTVDDDLVREAQRLTGVTEKAASVRLALEVLVEQESARRLARLAASAPEAEQTLRRRSAPS